MSTENQVRANSVRIDDDDPWGDARRLEGLAGETRVNLIRLIALLIFYAHHLLNTFVLAHDGALPGHYHTAATAVAIAWCVVVLLVHLCVSRGWMLAWLMYVVTAADIILITTLLGQAGDPKSTRAVLFFLIVAAAGLRLSLPLIYAATLGCMLAYGGFAVYCRFWLELSAQQQSAPASHIVFLLALGTSGLLAGQWVRQGRRLQQGQTVTVMRPLED